MDSVEVKYKDVRIATIHGRLTDNQGRCIHYHSILDVIANKCSVCGKYYSCYKCHDEMEDHPFGAVPSDEAASVMCGVCGHQFSYSEYEQMGGSCSNCGAKFNPGCSLHKCIYSDSK